jgi:16S rRNA processing protein RimM
MIPESSLFLLGKINKTHGLAGELSFTLISDIPFVDDLPCLMVDIDGIPVPFFVEEMRFSTDTTGFLKFEDIDNADDARPLAGLPLFIEKKYLNEEDIPQNDSEFYKGFRLTDEAGNNIGVVKYIETSTDNHLFVIENAGKQILIPVSDDYIINIDDKNKVICMQLPEGLLEL